MIKYAVAKMFGYVNFHELRAVSLRPDAQHHYENDLWSRTMRGATSMSIGSAT
jgi:hypothetical protein